MSFLMRVFRRGRGRSKDPLTELGLTMYQYNWLEERIETIRATIDMIQQFAEPNYVWGIQLLLRAINDAGVPWLRGDPLVRRRFIAWLQYAGMVIDRYNRYRAKGLVYTRDTCITEEGIHKDQLEEGEKGVCYPKLEGEEAVYLNNFARRVFTAWFVVMYDTWRSEDVGPSRIFLVPGGGAPPIPVAQLTPFGALPTGAEEQRPPSLEYDAYSVPGLDKRRGEE